MHRAQTQIITISIHAPRTGSDVLASTGLQSEYNFNPRSPHGERHASMVDSYTRIFISIHAPRTGSDMLRRANRDVPGAFQSTLPARGATRKAMYNIIVYEFQSTLPARGATSASLATCGTHLVFQSTLPARGATNKSRSRESVE